MKVVATGCYAGSRFFYRLEFEVMGQHVRERVSGDTWNRAIAGEAKDFISAVYGIKRSAIRFEVQ